MLVWDNQQATSWFIGILEAEGHFNKRDKCIVITNTDSDIINECVRYLNSLLLFPMESQEKLSSGKISYIIRIPTTETKLLYYHIINKMECRTQEYQRIMGASETIRTPTIDLHWLIGHWEGEGCLSLSRQQRIKNIHYLPESKTVNTNHNMISKVRKTLNSLNIPYYIKDYDGVFPRKPYQRLTCTGMKRCNYFLEATKDLWRSSRNIKRSKLLSDFIDSRLSKSQCEPYTELEHDIYYQLKRLNS